MSDVIDLGDQLEAFVAELVSDGRYPSRLDVLRRSVRLLEAQELKLAALDEGLDRGLADIEAGRVKTDREVFDRLEMKYRALAASKVP